jgi:O-antigen/teichoic acid export membrane protein
MLGLVGLGVIDIILVKKFLPADQAGLYSSISLLGNIILYVATPLSQVAFSFFTGKDSRHNSLLILILLTLVYLLIGGCAAVAYFFFPELVVGIIFGSKFLVVSHLIWLAAIFGTLYSLVALYSQYFISRNSWWGVLTFFTLVIQGLIIYVNHQSIEQIMTINITVAFLLLTLMVGRIALGKQSK